MPAAALTPPLTVTVPAVAAKNNVPVGDWMPFPFVAAAEDQLLFPADHVPEPPPPAPGAQ